MLPPPPFTRRLEGGGLLPAQEYCADLERRSQRGKCEVCECSQRGVRSIGKQPWNMPKAAVRAKPSAAEPPKKRAAPSSGGGGRRLRSNSGSNNDGAVVTVGAEDGQLCSGQATDPPRSACGSSSGASGGGDAGPVAILRTFQGQFRLMARRGAPPQRGQPSWREDWRSMLLTTAAQHERFSGYINTSSYSMNSAHKSTPVSAPLKQVKPRWGRQALRYNLPTRMPAGSGRRLRRAPRGVHVTH